MRRSSVYFVVGAFVALLVLASVLALVMTSHRNTLPPAVVVSGGETPEASVQQSVALIKAGDFAGFWKHALPPADYDTLRADWTRPRPDQQPISTEDRADFIKNVQQLTEPDAESKLYAIARPKLLQLQQQYHDQLPIMVGVAQAIAATGVAQSKDMTTPQKEHATAVINVLAPWAQQAPWFDQVRAKQAIAIVVDTARKLDIKTPEQLRAMDFDTAMQKYSVGFLGVKQVLLLYGLSVDQTLDSVKVTLLENRNGHARVRIDYLLLGKPLSVESDLIQQDGRWYSADVLQNVRDAHDRLMEPAPATSSTEPTQPLETSIKGAAGELATGKQAPGNAKTAPASAASSAAPARH
jgi:hypothetical protein